MTTGSGRVRTVICEELSSSDSLIFNIDLADELILTLRESNAKGFHFTLEQIIEELLPPEDADLQLAIDHCYGLAVPLAILLQRAVTG